MPINLCNPWTTSKTPERQRCGIQRKNFRILQKTENQANIFETVSSSVTTKAGIISLRAKVPTFLKKLQGILYIYIYIFISEHRKDAHNNGNKALPLSGF